MGRGVSTCATCDGFFFRNRPVAIVGGGDTALEEAIYLSKLASHVTVIHRRDTLRASKIMQDKAFASPKISFRWNTAVDEILSDERGDVNRARLRNLQTGEVDELAVDGVFVAIGHTPNTRLFKGQLDMDEGGYLVTKGTRTNIPGVFAAGDVQDQVYRQAITSAGTGCMAAMDAERWLELGDAEYHHRASRPRSRRRERLNATRRASCGERRRTSDAVDEPSAALRTAASGVTRVIHPPPTTSSPS